MSLRKKIIFSILAIFLLGFLIPQNLIMPVVGATKASYHPKSFWYYPWGKSVTHKGLDIFAKQGTNVVSASGGLVVYTGNISMGGNVVIILGPKWRFHYYAHLKEIKTSKFSWVGKNKTIATVGSSGNAAGKPPHLHYTIATLIPYFWLIDIDHQGWKKMFYLNPIKYLEKT